MLAQIVIVKHSVLVLEDWSTVACSVVFLEDGMTIQNSHARRERE
jgi:hypothetical protein